jgi:hypothetical protein
MRVATRAGGRAHAQEADMTVDVNTDARAKPSAAYVDRRLIGGSAALMTGGLLVCLVGASVGVVAVVGACRRFVAAMEESPTYVARRRWEQARSATMAGVGAWQDYGRQGRP